MKVLIILTLTILVGCGQNNCSGGKSRNTYVNWQKVNAICSQRSYQNRCSNVVAEFKLVPQDFFSQFCFEQYSMCRQNER